MPNEIYHRSNWGESKAEGFGDVYYDHAATNKLYNHSDYYENSDGTDATLKDLNNKASIVLTPTAYSDGSLNTVIPPYQVLSELVTNGTFDTDSNWLKSSTATISNGSAHIVSDGSYQYIGQVLVLTVGKKYRVEYEIIENNSGNLKMSSSFGSNFSPISSTVGFHSFEAFAIASTFYIERQTACDIKIDNVSVKEIQEADFDFSRGSSATRVNEQGLVEDSQGDDYPRIDFTDGTGSLLLEPQRTNLYTYSEDFSQSYWTKLSLTATPTSKIAPDGNVGSVYNIVGTNANLFAGGTTGVEHTISFFIKSNSAGKDKFKLRLGNNTSDVFTATNEWIRYSFTSTPATAVFGITTSASPNNELDLLVWGAQAEAGDYPTSYIVSNSGSATTRSADVANNSGNADLFNDSEGVLYAEIAALADDGTARRMSISDSSTSNRVVLMYHSTSNVVRGFVSSGGSLVSDMTYTVSDTTQVSKIAFSYKQDDFKIFIDGVQRTTDDSGNTPTGLKELAFDGGSGSNDFYGDVKCVAVFKEALSNDLLERLTGEGYESFRLLAEANNYTII